MELVELKPFSLGTVSRAFNNARNAVAIVTIPFVVVACSNSKPVPNTAELAPIGSTSNSVEQNVIVPEKKPSGGLLAEIARTNETVNTGSNGQNFVEPHRQTASVNIISNQTKFSSKAYGVAGSPRVTTSTNVRKGGGRYQIGKPYTIRGIRYVPREDPNYRAVGLASWYGPNFHGRLTANGEVYDQFALSAAHPTMPLPSYAKVTNLETGSSVTVRVSDRGPFSKRRIIDLSSRAAQLLGYTKKGIAKVKVEYVGRARMDGLDEQQLMATYYPGTVDQNTIPASARPVVVASGTPKAPEINKAKPELIAAIAQPTASRRTLDAFDSTRFGFVTGGDAAAPRPNSLVNGYVASADQNQAFAMINQVIGTPLEAPIEGMNTLVRVRVGPITSKYELFRISEKLSEYGPVNIVENSSTSEFVAEATVDRDQIEKLKAEIN